MKNYIIGIVFLLIQVFFVIYAQFIPERFFCWRPFDNHTYYNIDVEINNKLLSEYEIGERYHYFSRGWEPRSVHNVFSFIKQYETTYGINDFAKVTVHYSENGHPTEIWELNN